MENPEVRCLELTLNILNKTEQYIKSYSFWCIKKVAAYGSDIWLPTQIKVYLRNMYFYKSNNFEICKSGLVLKLSICMLLKDIIFHPGLNLQDRIQPSSICLFLLFNIWFRGHVIKNEVHLKKKKKRGKHVNMSTDLQGTLNVF